MTDLATEAAPETQSTTLEADAPNGPSGAGAPDLKADPPEPKVEPASLRDVIADEAKKVGEEAKAEEKTEEKPAKDRAEDGKFKAKSAGDTKEAGEAKDAESVKDASEAAETKADGKADAKPEDDSKGARIEAPKNFLPDAKETWRNTPRAVQRDVEQMVRRHEAEVTELREATQRYEAIREYDQLAQSNGRDLKDSLAKIAEIEDLMVANPYAGLNAILQEIGPRRPDGSAPTLFEVAQYVVKQGPENWQQMVAARPQAQQQQQQESPEIVQMRQQIAQMQAQAMTASVIEPFKAAHPRYEELRDDIALFLKSGRIPDDLSPADKLAAAYDMAVRINPTSHVEPANQPSPDTDRRADPDGSSGTKSIRSAPGSVLADHAPERGGSIRDLLNDELKRQKRA